MTDLLTISLAYRTEDCSAMPACFTYSIPREKEKSSLIETSPGGHDSDFFSAASAPLHTFSQPLAFLDLSNSPQARLLILIHRPVIGIPSQLDTCLPLNRVALLSDWSAGLYAVLAYAKFMRISLKKMFIFHTPEPHTNQQYIPKHSIIFISCPI